MKDTNMVYHLAANPDVKFTVGSATDKDLHQNVIGTYHVLENMRREGVRRLAFASTSAVYGVSRVQPIPENSPMQPISLYGASKLSCEAMIGAFQHLFSMNCWVFRFANIVGRKVRKSGQTVIGDFIVKLHHNPHRLQILGDGRQAKSYLLTEECVDAILFAVEHARDGLNIFNLGCSDSLPVRRIADMIVDAMGLDSVQYEFTGGEGGWPGDVPCFVLDVNAIRRLGWTAHFTSEQAVLSAIHSTLTECEWEQPCRP
jgi:UDP-glucose 4-epimerase